MTIPEKAVEWAVKVAQDNSHGYDQSSRWGPDYDCSSLVISAYKAAGVPLTCTYTGNMRSNMLDNGFVIPVNVNLATGAGLQPGDVLLNVQSHTALYIGDGQIVQASINEEGKATGGKTGDQTGREIAVINYYNFPWEYVLRYEGENAAEKPTTGGYATYTVKSGDSLWGIAERELGNGFLYDEIRKLNGLSDYWIYPGQILKLPKMGESTAKVTVELRWSVLNRMEKAASAKGITLAELIESAFKGE